MKALLRNLSILIAITCVVWLAVLWHWQSTQRDTSIGDIALYLGALPLALFAVAVAGRWAFVGIDERAAQRLADRSGANTSADTRPTPTAGQAERHAAVRLLSAQVNCAAGNTPGDVASAIGQRRPSLDPELIDEQGMPLLAARIDGLAVEGLSPSLGLAEQLARNRDPAWAAAQASPSLPRALAALLPCLDASIAALTPWRERLGVVVDQPGDSAIETPDGDAGTGMAARLLVYVAWPADATAFDRAVADLWLQRTIEDRRVGVAAVGRILRPPADVVRDGAALLQLADEAMARMRRDAVNDLVLLLACESHLDQACVQRWQLEGSLCSSRQPKGRVPGEGAAALLLAPTTWQPTKDDADSGREVLLQRPALARRDKSIDAAGRIDAAVAKTVVEQAMAASGLAAEQVASVVSDADQTTPRGVEVHSTVHALLPQLEAATDVLLAGTSCGSAGAASTLATIALAAARVAASEQPCLAFSVVDPHSRVALVARPSKPAAEAATPPAVPAV